MKLSTICLSVLVVAPLWAADLVQLVPPSATTITLYPGQTRALVRETRAVSLPAGGSTLSFSWTATSVDAASATLAVDGASVGDAVRVAGQDKLLQWRVSAPQALRGETVLTYFLDGFKWSTSYRMWLQGDGQTARLVGYLHLENQTGVDLEGVGVQVAVGGPGVIDRIGGEGTAPTAAGVVTLHALAAPLTLANGETGVRPLLLLEAVPAAVHYLYQAERFNGGVERLLILALPAGLAGLPDGALAIYGPEPEALPVFVTQLSYQPGQEFKVDLGPEPDVVVERKLMNVARSNFETDRFGRFTGSDTTEEYRLQVRNHLADAIVLEFTETVLSTWELKSPLQPDKTETSWAEFHLRADPGHPAELPFTLIKHSGTRVK